MEEASNAPSAPDTAPDRPGTGKVVTLLVLAALFAYYNSLHATFVFDDSAWIKEPEVAHPLQSGLTRTRPVVSFSFYINYKLDGLNGRGYHAANVLIHTLAALAVYALVRRTLLLPRYGTRYADRAGWLGLTVAMVWLVHPLNTQSVTYAIQRCESLMGLFYLLALWCFVRGATAARGGGWWFAGSVLACALGVGCKEVALTFPFVAAVYDRTFLSGSWRGVLRRWPVYLALAVPVAAGVGNIVAMGILSDAGDVGFGVKLFTPKSYLLTQTEVLLHYLRLSFWPDPLCLDYMGWVPKTSLAQVWPQATVITLLGLASAAGVLYRTGAGFLGAWFFLILAPSSSVMPIQDAAFEHRMYLSLLAVVAAVVFALDAALVRLRAAAPEVGGAATRFAGAVAVAAVVVFAWMTVLRNEDYSSISRMYGDVVQKYPNNFRTRTTYASVLLNSGNPEGAEEVILPAVRNPLQTPLTQLQYVAVLRAVGKTQQALDLGAALVAARPDDPQAALEHGRTLVAVGRPGEAVPLFRAALARPQDRRVARLYLAIALTESGQAQQADEVCAELRADDPGAGPSFLKVARGVATTREAKPADLTLAAQIATVLVRLVDPADPEPTDTLALCAARLGRYEEAARLAGRAAELARAAGWEPDRVARVRERQALFVAKKPFLAENVN